MSTTETPTDRQLLAAEAEAAFHDACRQQEEAIPAHAAAKAKMISCKLASDRAKADELETRTLKENCFTRYKTTFWKAYNAIEAVNCHRVGSTIIGKTTYHYIQLKNGSKHGLSS
jgi:hypothetical protein